MIRLIVITLVAANLLFAGFQATLLTPEKKIVQALARVQVDHLPEIRLMSELENGGGSAAQGRQCFTVGPFETASSKERARDLLNDHADAVIERTTEALMELGYWVSLPAYPTLAEAGEAVRELRKTGLEDLGMVNDDSDDYLVSLGYFLDENNALRRRDQARELGFPAETRPQREGQPRYWLDYELPTGAPLATQALSDSIPAGLHRMIPCVDTDVQSGRSNATDTPDNA